MKHQSRSLQWFGSDCDVSEHYAERLADCKHVTVLMCGGLSAAAHLVKTASEVICNDAHKLAMNFYRVMSDPRSRAELIEKLDRTPFHQELLSESQEICKACETIDTTDAVLMAFRYFITNWMGRGGKGGTESEFSGSLPIRWTASGGSSPKRFNTAVRSIQDYWGPICERCSFVCLDAFDMLKKLAETSGRERRGVYVDPPWHGAGDGYVHKFTRHDHILLAEWLTRLSHTDKIVVRYGDHPYVREDYSNSVWRIEPLKSRSQANGGVAELCITNF